MCRCCRAESLDWTSQRVPFYQDPSGELLCTKLLWPPCSYLGWQRTQRLKTRFWARFGADSRVVATDYLSYYISIKSINIVMIPGWAKLMKCILYNSINRAFIVNSLLPSSYFKLFKNIVSIKTGSIISAPPCGRVEGQWFQKTFCPK